MCGDYLFCKLFFKQSHNILWIIGSSDKVVSVEACSVLFFFGYQKESKKERMAAYEIL